MKPMKGYSAGAGERALRRTGRLAALLAGLVLLAHSAPLAGQTAPRLWAAQTGPNAVTLTWDSIPGTHEYLIYAAPIDSVVGNLRMKPPLQRLSASSRTSYLFGIQRLTGGITLVAMAANGHVIQKAAFNAITRASSASTIQPPEEVTATATGPTEITLSWTPVPGATAYYIGRAVAPGGFSTLCAVCSAEPSYVDRDVAPGVKHTYSVAAIFPDGKSRPAPSNDVTPGVTQVATTAVAPTSATAPAPSTSGTTYVKGSPGTTLNSTTPSTTGTSTVGDTTVSYSTSSSYDAAHGTVTTITTATTCTVAAPQRCWSTTSSVTSAYTPPASTGTTTTTTTASTPTSSGTTTATVPTSTTSTAPDTAQASSGGIIGGILSAASSAVGTLTGAVSPPAAVSAVSPAPASVRLTWQASPTAGVTAYRVSRRINNGLWQLLSTVGPTVLAYADNFFPTTLFASGPVSVSYSVVAAQNNISSSMAQTGALTVQPPASTATTATTTVSTTSTTSCKLDYQRADNMWAAFGRPDGQLGTETISLAPGKDKVFITDWTYEKQRNDGTNYYGSHLRIATNNSTHSLRIQVRTLTLTSWVPLAPGKTQQFQADLMEVFCEN